MALSVYDFDKYREFVKRWIDEQPHGGRGVRTKIARVTGCHSAYVTNVLSGRTNFSLEQAESLASLLSLDPGEKHFFLLLVQKERSGSKSLAEHFEVQIRLVLEKRGALRVRAGFIDQIAENLKLSYYSDWRYSAIHIAVAIPKYNSAEKLAYSLGIPKKFVDEVISVLVQAGLVVQGKNGLYLGKGSTHLGDDSKLIKIHHTNWRMQAISSLDRGSPSDFHYSSIAALSEESARKIRALLLESVEKIRAEVRTSKEESCYGYCLDLFKMNRER